MRDSTATPATGRRGNGRLRDRPARYSSPTAFLQAEALDAPADQQFTEHLVESVELPPHRIDLSVVIPVLNEVESLQPLYEKCTSVLESWGRPYELIFIDDGSTDGSGAVLQRLEEDDGRVQVLRFRRNFGQTAAFSAGFERATGPLVVTLDADLQNDPADIPRLVENLEAGDFDIVSGWRVRRQDALWSRKIPSRAANALISWITGVRLHDYGCSLKVYRVEVVRDLRLYGEMHRFIPAAASWMGVAVGELPVSHHPRRFGKSKYGLSRVVKVLLDLIVLKFLLSYAGRPMRVFGLLGLLSLAAGLALGTYLSLERLLFDSPLGDRPLLLLAVFLVMFGVQLFTTGLLSELLTRTYYETQGKRPYVIRSNRTPRTTPVSAVLPDKSRSGLVEPA